MKREDIRVVCMKCGVLVRGRPDAPHVSHGYCRPCGEAELKKYRCSSCRAAIPYGDMCRGCERDIYGERPGRPGTWENPSYYTAGEVRKKAWDARLSKNHDLAVQAYLDAVNLWTSTQKQGGPAEDDAWNAMQLADEVCGEFEREQNPLLAIVGNPPTAWEQECECPTCCPSRPRNMQCRILLAGQRQAARHKSDAEDSMRVKCFNCGLPAWQCGCDASLRAWEAVRNPPPSCYYCSHPLRSGDPVCPQCWAENPFKPVACAACYGRRGPFAWTTTGSFGAGAYLCSQCEVRAKGGALGYPWQPSLERTFKAIKPRHQNPSSLAAAQHLPGFQKAHDRFIQAHGAPPTGVKLVKVQDGKSGITKKVVFTMGDIPEFVYQGTIGGKKIKGSNKASKTWVHKTAKHNMPMLAVDPETEQLFALGGETKATDWLREKSERRRKH